MIRHLHFCCDMDGWVLEKTARLLMRHIPGSTIGEYVAQDADVNVYFPYYRLDKKGPSVDAALFTHLEMGDDAMSNQKRGWFERAARLADVKLAMSVKTQKLLPGSALMPLPSDPRYMRDKPIRFGVCGREYQSGRKRLDWIPRGMPGTEWYWTGGRLTDEEMIGFYSQIDYLVVVSDNEGGPLPLKEALAAGKPVIAPDVGWAWEYPVIRYEGAQGLYDTVRALVPRDETFNAARALMSAVWQVANKEAA